MQGGGASDSHCILHFAGYVKRCCLKWPIVWGCQEQESDKEAALRQVHMPAGYAGRAK